MPTTITTDELGPDCSRVADRQQLQMVVDAFSTITWPARVTVGSTYGGRLSTGTAVTRSGFSHTESQTPDVRAALIATHRPARTVPS